MAFLQPKGKKEEDNYFIPLSDVMTALMLLFLLISVVYMIKVQDIVQIPRIFKETSQGLKDELSSAFESDFKGWGAMMDGDLTLRFANPDILFKTGSSTLSPKFRDILDDFFPRYLRIIMNNKFKDTIEEIRIEGHTSSFWGDLSGDDAYMNNMALSQERTRAVLAYILSMDFTDEQKQWIRKHIRAIGFSSAVPLNYEGERLQEGEREHALNSQRVEFRVRTNIERKIREVSEMENNATK